METFTSAEAKALSAALAPAIGRDKARPGLMAVRLRGITGTLTFDVTDAYRAHRVTVSTGTDYQEAFDLAIMDGAAFAKAFAVAARDAGRNGAVTMTFTDATVTVAGPSVSQVFPTGYTGQYGGLPNVDPLFDKATDAAGECAPAAFDAGRLADAVTAGGAVADLAAGFATVVVVGNVTVARMDPKSSGLITATGGRFGFAALVMPMRVR